MTRPGTGMSAVTAGPTPPKAGLAVSGDRAVMIALTDAQVERVLRRGRPAHS